MHKMELKKEKSCGAVLYRTMPDASVRYLVEVMQLGHTALCKGHVEGNETEHQTARREIEEETGLYVSFRDGFRECVSYAPNPGVIKEVVYYLAEEAGGVERAQPEEVASLRWLSYPDALDALTYDNDKDILRKAEAFRSLSVSDSPLRQAERILHKAVSDALPGTAVRKALASLPAFSGKLILVAVGKAAWEMANEACLELSGTDRYPEKGIVVTKEGHARGPIESFQILEAGHPVPDERSFAAADAVLQATEGLKADDLVLFLLSGGGSALFEKPLIPKEEYRTLTGLLLRSGAPIEDVNVIRKHLSAVKGGRFAEHCLPASVYAVLLSDVLGDDPATIASGPVSPDPSSASDAARLLQTYGIPLTQSVREALNRETPKTICNATVTVTGSVRTLCESAVREARALGYEPVLVTDRLTGEAKEAGRLFAKLAKEHTGSPKAYIAGGETTVRVTGNGWGGRNQEMAVACAEAIDGMENVFFFSFGSDGTDGPTDAAGGFADGQTAEKLRDAGFPAGRVLQDNDSYHALEAIGQLLVTGPTGTNVNDLSVLLCGPSPLSDPGIPS